jgi:glycosyltransferase involved in cell wall biosynthesis
MIKYSIIIPVYNKEKYLKRCIDSVLNQYYKVYEIIIIDDGSTDKSEDIIKYYCDERIRFFSKKNGGVSDARNYGITKACGKYFTFVDADDYVSDKLLSTIDRYIEDDIDVLSFNIVIDNDYSEEKPAFYTTSGEKALTNLIKSTKMFDTPVAYIYSVKYFLDNGFKYVEGKLHEDFGLTPLTIIKANKFKSIQEFLYYYIRNGEGITGDKLTLKKKAWDVLYHFDFLYSDVNKDKNISKETKRIFNSYIANATIRKVADLINKEQDEYILELKKRNVSSLLLEDNIFRIIKKMLIKLNLKMYVKVFLGKGNR